MVPDDEIGILAHLDGTDAIVDLELLRGVDGHHRERLVFGHVTVANRLGGFHVQPPGLFGVVGIDRDEHPLVRHQRGVVGDGVGRLHLVTPPVGEGRRARVVRGDLLGDLVALEHVLKRRDLEAYLVGEPNQHQDFVGAIAVRMDQALAFENLDEGVELEVAAGRRPGQPSSRSPVLPVLPGRPSRVASRMTYSTPCRVVGNRCGLVGAWPRLRVTFSPRANLMPGSAPWKMRSFARVLP